MTKSIAFTDLIVEHYCASDEDLGPADPGPALEDCGVGLSDDALLHWPELPQR